MATEQEPVVPVEEVADKSAAPDAANTPVPEVQPTPAPETPAPVAHDPWLVHQAKQLDISPEDINLMSPTELQRSVVMLARQQARLAQASPPQVKVDPTPTPEPEWDLPADVKAELEEVNPAILRAITLAGKAHAEKTKKLEADLAQARQQQSGQEFGQRVASEMGKIAGLGTGPVKEGSQEHAKRNAVLNHLAYLEQTGQLNGVPPEVAIPMAYKTLFGESPAPGVKSTPPVPTPSAKPSRRLQDGDGGLSARELLLRQYQAKLDQWDAEEGAETSRNGSFRP